MEERLKSMMEFINSVEEEKKNQNGKQTEKSKSS